MQLEQLTLPRKVKKGFMEEAVFELSFEGVFQITYIKDR